LQYVYRKLVDFVFQPFPDIALFTYLLFKLNSKNYALVTKLYIPEI
jgi:hypothetical protein